MKKRKIGTEQIEQAVDTLNKYKSGKANLESRIVENEQWWKMRHWAYIHDKQESHGHRKPTSAWLFNSLANKHADAMDNYPAPCVLPAEESDQQTADSLSSIIPTILERCDYEQVYSDTWWYKLKTGTGVKKVVWNTQKDGIGDIDIVKCDILDIYWAPGITDIQASPNLFHVELRDLELLKKEYPKAELESGSSVDKTEYIYDENIDTSDKVAVIDWYYKVNDDDKTLVHLCKFANGKVLYSSENDPETRSTGIYDHGKYPFVFDVLYPVEGSPAGFGMIDVCKPAQAYIDELDQAFLDNALVCSRKRYLARADGNINEQELMDLEHDIVHVSGNVDEAAIREIRYTPLSGIYANIQQGKIQELKETSGNRDFSQGATSSGVTAASAISALQEAGSKLSRDMIKASYRAFKEECYFIIELIRQFYDLPRIFRITGETGSEFVKFDNSGMAPIPQGTDFGVDMGDRLPIFDIKVVAEKESSYSRLSQNELALQLYQVGMFDPSRADQALAVVRMMKFEGKEEVVKTIRNNKTMYDMIQELQGQLLQLSMIVDSQNGTTVSQENAMAAAANNERLTQVGAARKAKTPSQSMAQRTAAVARSQGTPK